MTNNPQSAILTLWIKKSTRKNKEGGDKMKHRRKVIWAYLDGRKLIEVIQAALDNNMNVDDMKQLLIRENPGHDITFKVLG